MIWLAVLGCTDETVLLNGVVYESHDLLSPALAGAEIHVVDFDGTSLSTATADGGGRFETEVPGGIPVFVEVSAEGYSVTPFPGVIGLAPVQTVDDHALYGVSDAERADWLARFTGCPGADGDRAIVLGEMRIYGLEDPLTGESPTIGTGIVTVTDGEQTEAAGCYFDPAGERYDPAAEVTGDSGAFAVFGVEPGLHDLQLEGAVSETLSASEVYPLWIPDRPNVVSPWYPAWLPFPF